MGRLTFFFLLSLFACAWGQDAESIECPFPGGPSDASESNCDLYSSCQWSGSECHMRENSEIGYTVISAPQDTGRGFKLQVDVAYLQNLVESPSNRTREIITVEGSITCSVTYFQGGPIFCRVDLQKQNSFTMFEGDIEYLTFEVIYHEDYHIQFKITDTNNARYEVPVPLNLPDSAGSNPMYDVVVSDVGEPFAFTISRSSNGNIIFDTVGPLTYEDQFIQISTKLASDYLYGFGENTHLKFRHVFEPRSTWAIYARDQIVSTEPLNEYGHHPYYMVMEDDTGIAHSGLFFGSNAMEYSTFNLADGTPSLTFRVIGGIINMHFFLGSNPEELNVLYTNMIGRPIFPPYFSLGFQVSRWGYNSTNHVRQVRQRMKDNNIPQDIQVLDIDYMDRFRDFTTNTEPEWADLDELIEELHADNLKVTVILDPGVVVDFDNYPPGERGRQADAYIKWSDPDLVPDDQPPNTGDYMVGYCWPDEKTVYPDFFKKEAQEWWIDEIIRLKEEVDFDVLWIDMNEVANFGTDTDRPWNYPPELPDWSLKCPYNKFDSPPYPTKTTYTGSTESFRLSDHSLCLSAMLTDGNNTYMMYDVHSLYGWSQTPVSNRAMNQIFPGQRNIILSRSTFPSSGQYAVHWLGDNVSQWPQIHMSIIGMIEFNMFGIPYVGADICGFIDPTTEEMCHRWMEIGAFYPFTRNHNANENPDQDPGMWPAVAETSREVLNLRYKYNPYLYALFHRAHMDGNSVVRPLLNTFPTDIPSRDVDDQFMWGDGLMIAPVLTESTFERDVYFPPSNWYDLQTGELISAGGETLLIPAPINVIPLYVKGGSILPFQEPAITTTESRLNPFGVTVAIQDGEAVGEIFWDDGVSDHDMASSYLASLAFSQNTLTLTVDNQSTYVDSLSMTSLSFYGVQIEPTGVSLDDVPIDTWTYDSSLQVLSVDIDVPLNQGFILSLTP